MSKTPPPVRGIPWCERYVQAVYLFGSHARGRQRPDSDLDLAVLLPSQICDGEVWKKRLLLGARAAESLERENARPGEGSLSR
ncbi:MAG: nucleotidyltransferase domain-containing protein [Candidatus Eremiobacteraeota bacterium]|nr:nucleotidyltransferase domain-containing protein [Candidatus Eremiobacteraeota bacterium]MCW5866187.1 nucleotidyltransferase domain-containing protein [Candidatus Eremiobacteraeota bacterium]